MIYAQVLCLHTHFELALGSVYVSSMSFIVVVVVAAAVAFVVCPVYDVFVVWPAYVCAMSNKITFPTYFRAAQPPNNDNLAGLGMVARVIPVHGADCIDCPGIWGRCVILLENYICTRVCIVKLMLCKML